ncbi:dTDP-glucose pyrophosphorylase [Pontibacter sp. KCTC 32443]|uniref:sugar phosphate nucleotidyltransferase n=1 Tax=Pontibacter TaxID=323449 RepID=UPI00164DE9DD|nr:MULTISPECIES: sugar phosphate nucleotidyltransferase [Pontibacter]MBC5772963.1 dTDP-glucose pyrophosphorylase [Pontibacter sp. KCTC 32443]
MQNIVGIIPAAGLGSRLGGMAFSKELFPIGFEVDESTGQEYPKAVSQYLLELMRKAGVAQTYVILRDGKWDIPSYFGDGSKYKMQLAYLMMNRPYGTPFSVDQAYNFVKGKTIVFGFPDILVEPKNVFVKLLEKQQQTQADVVLGLFKIANPHKWDMVETDETGNVKNILPKPESSDLKHAWCIAVWSPAFTEYMHQYLQQVEPEFILGELKELPMGSVIQVAIGNGMIVQSVCFHEGNCLDIGTPEDLKKAIKRLT